MGASLKEEERQLVVVLLPRHQPVGLYVTFPLVFAIARQLVGTILGGQGAIGFEKGNGIQNQLNVKSTLAAKFHVFLEACGVVNAIHGCCESR